MLKNFLFSTLLIFAAMAAVHGQGTQQYRSPNDIDLPPLENRHVIGTWLTDSIGGSCTRSFELVKGTTYTVLRCSDGSGGKEGQVLKKVSAKKSLPRSSTAGDHYVILDNGDLSVRDKQGEIGVEPRHAGLWPGTPSTKKIASKAEDSKTENLSCYNVGYRYGYTGTSSYKGKKVNSAWDFATPDRCKNDPQTIKGIQAGTHSAW